MKRLVTYMIVACGLLMSFTSFGGSASAFQPNDIYLIFYVTKPGFTGHVGIAIDNYRILVRDTLINGKRESIYDSVRSYSLTYFDLWGPPEIKVDEHNSNLPPRYFKLPRSTAEARITMDYFLSKGLPHSYDRPCDALLRIHTTPAQDYQLIKIAEGLQEEKNYFNTRTYNCTDYIIACLNRLWNIEIEAKEYIPFAWSSTPNQLYKELVAKMDVEIVKKPEGNLDNSFFIDRVLKTQIYNQFINNHEKTN